jgi:hypothetical protein
MDNMQTIMLQQLELHFGEEFQTLYNNTRSYVKSLISRPWWVDRKALIDSEGPLSRMVEDCLARVVEKGDKQEGWQSYTSYLSSMYGSTNSHAKSVLRDDSWNQDSFVWSTLGAYSNGAPQEFLPPVGDTLVVEDDMSDDSPFDEEHKEFLQIYSTLGVDAAAEIYDMTPEQARTRRNTIKRTVARRLVSS